MKTHTPDSTKSAPATHATSRRTLRRAALWTAGCLGALLLLAVIFCAAATLLLTPQRLASLITEKSEKYLDATVEIADADFTLWSTFPHLTLRADSIRLTARTLDSLTPAQRRLLPDDASFLASASRLEGGINLLSLLAGRISLRDVALTDLRVNLVALSDSLTNYNIIRAHDDRNVDVPVITADSIRLLRPQPVTYFSAASGSQAEMRLSSASLRRLKKGRNSYDLRIAGLIDARADSLWILRDFPFTLDGETAFAFHPFRVRLSDYAIDLGNAHGKVNLALRVGEDLRVNSFDYHLSDLNLSRLLGYLPPQLLPALEGIRTDLTVDASARLTKPYSYAPSRLPSLAVDFSIPEGEVSYKVAGEKPYTLRHLGIRASLLFDGDNPALSRFLLPECDLRGDGADIRLSGSVADLLGDPLVDARICGTADMTRLSEALPYLRPLRLKGNATTDSRVRFRISDLKNGDFSTLEADGHASLRAYAVSVPARRMTLSGDALDISFVSQAASLSPTAISQGKARASLRAPHLRCTLPSDTILLSGLALKASAPATAIGDGFRHIPLLLDLTAERSSLRQDSLRTDMRQLHLTTECHPATIADHCMKGHARLTAAEAKLRAGLNSVSLSDVAATLGCTPAPRRSRKAAAPAGAPDRALLNSISHSPEYLVADVPKALRDLFSHWDVSGSVKASKALVLTPLYPVRNELDGIDIVFTPEELALRSLALRSQSNRLAMSARLSGLRRLLTMPGPQPIRLDMNLALDTIDFNSVAGAFEAGVRLTTGKEYYTPTKHSETELTAADSVTMLVPRNLEAHIRATAKETVYTNLHLYDLAASIDAADGLARLSDLSVSSDFGRAGMTLAYDTRDAADMDLHAAVRLDSIDVVSFFRNFHSLLLMMPQMSNLSGYVSADATAGFDIFPDMFVNVPSVLADVNVEGRELTVHQDDFIRHITRMLLIREDGDLHIADMDVHATVHDNLLELFPFEFATGGYELTMLGLNNFNGEMYYHIGVDRSPLHIPFGINIKGDFHHPEFRFGGARYGNEKAWPITSGISEAFDINMLRELKYYTKEFVHKAAESSTAPASDFLFGSEKRSSETRIIMNTPTPKDMAEATATYARRHGVSPLPLRAALIDMDGVLYDTMKYHTLAWHRMMSELGIDCTRDEFYLYEGMTGAATINHLFRRAYGHEATPEQIKELYARKAEYFQAYGRKEPMPGALRMLRTFAGAGAERVLVTGSGQLSVLESIDRDFPGCIAADKRVTSRDVTHGKPHPEPYLRGLALAGCRPEEAIVVENAPLGVRAGTASGCFTVAVTTGPIPREAFEAEQADLIFPSMEAFADALPSLITLRNCLETN